MINCEVYLVSTISTRSDYLSALTVINSYIIQKHFELQTNSYNNRLLVLIQYFVFKSSHLVQHCCSKASQSGDVEGRVTYFHKVAHEKGGVAQFVLCLEGRRAKSLRCCN